MKVTELYDSLLEKDISISIVKGKLRVASRSKRIPSELQTLILENKNDLLELLEGGEVLPDSSKLAMSKVDRSLPVELSFAQQRLWFLSKLEGTSANYNIPMALRLSGKLNKEALFFSLKAIVARHEVLRTRFVESDGTAYQFIEDADHFQITEAQLDDENELSNICESEALTPFDLGKDMLIRAQLLSITEDEYALLVTLHHSIADGWSMGIFFKELVSLYRAYSNNEPSPLAPLPIQYADFSHWQRQWLSGEVMDSLLVYWKEQLADLPPLLDLPTDRKRPPIQTYRGARKRLHFSTELLEELNSLSQSQGATLYMTLLTGFATLLSRYSNQTDIAIGSPIANRNRPEIEGLIGFFVNTLVMRADVSDDPTFLDLLEQVKETALAAYAHQDIPFEYLVEALEPERNMSYSPLFQVMFVLQNIPVSNVEFPDFSISPIAIDFDITKFDMTLNLQETEEGLQGSVEYNTDLFDESTIERFIGHYEKLLRGIVGKPEKRVSEYGLLSDAELHTQLVEWNKTEVPYRSEKCIHELIEEQVSRKPDSTAIECDGRKMTYNELNERSNQLAHYLIEQGVGPEILVGICIDRSIDMIIGLLGILKAGGAYVPIDPGYPEQRIRYILEDSGVGLILSQSSLSEVIPEMAQKAVFLDKDADSNGNVGLISKQSTENIATKDIQLSSSNLAYIIYTSGSTGKPKGVMVEHEQLANFMETVSHLYHWNSTDRILQFATLNFDISVEEIFGTLSVGATLVLRTDAWLASSVVFWELAKEHEISILDLSTAFWEQIIPDKDSEIPKNIKQVIFSGEKVNAEKINEWFRLKGELPELINAYGPTETTVTSTYIVVEENGVESSIGRPVANTQAYVVDGNDSPVPIGVVGELVIGGGGVTRGYLNGKELTEEKYSVYSTDYVDSCRVYRTGDLVRWLPNGELDYIGRTDSQVKVRGFRIELEEIENQLNRHPSVKYCAVIVREDQQTEKCIVAYIVSKGKEVELLNVNIQTMLRGYLSENLPDYMIPNCFVEMDSLPLTPSKKLDIKALPIPKTNQLFDDEFIAASTVSEIELVKIWADMFNVDDNRVSVKSNFFSLGGHSLLAIRMANSVSKYFGVEIPVIEIFQYPTIEKLAKHIDSQLSFGCGHRNIILLKDGDSTPLIFVHHPGGYAWNYIALAQLLPENMCVYGLQYSNASDEDLAKLSVEAVARFHVENILIKQPTGPYRLIGHSGGGQLAYEIAYQLLGRNKVVDFVGLIDTYNFSQLGCPDSDQGAVKVALGFLSTVILQHRPETILENLEALLSDKGLEDLPDLFDSLVDLKLVPSEYDLETILLQSQFFYAMDKACAEYVPPPLPTNVYLYAASLKDSLSDLGWKDKAHERWRNHGIGGDHKTILEAPHIDSLAEHISTDLVSLEKSTSLVIERFDPFHKINYSGPNCENIFCIPGAGSNSSSFISLAGVLDGEYNLFGAHYKGLDGNLVPNSTIPDAACEYVRAIRAIAPKGPYRLVGHSFGGLVAVEIACQLEKLGEQVKPVILLDTAIANKNRPKMQNLSRVEKFMELVHIFEQLADKNYGIRITDFTYLKPNEQVLLLKEKMEWSGVISKSNSQKDLESILRVFFSQLDILYKPEIPFSGKLVLLSPESDCSSSESKNDLMQSGSWSDYANSLTTERINGNHMTLLQKPNIHAVVKCIETYWDE
ncbi:MAG: non-ribosomal peptide synthetase [Blastopirellula sp.]|nr:MAG: non-ribosomal peptide synthetase [Blastopirellula sp.]